MINHLVVGGCSMTASSIGGVPLQGCSYSDGDQLPKSWADFVAKELKVQSLVNVAASSHGNHLIASSLLEVLTRFNYDAKNTLVLFNITYPGRFDVPCEFGHRDQSDMVPWGPDIIPYTYVTNLSNTHRVVHDISPSQINVWLVSLFNFLENQNFNYRFLLAEDFSNDADIGLTIKQFKNKLVTFDQYLGMVEFIKSQGMLKDITHPTVDGHQEIAKHVINSLK